MERRGPSHSGPFGLACTSCFKAKCKCVARSDGDGCQRCHRLNKQCRPSDSLRRRIDKKPNPAGRIADLESKLDGLISRLESRGVLDGDTAGQSSSEHVAPAAQSQDEFAEQDAVENEPRNSDHSEDEDGHVSQSVRWSDSPRIVTVSAQSEPAVSDAEADTLLGIFRSCMVCHFAFVHLSGHLTAHELRRKRPFLFRAIICVASRSAEDRATRAKNLKRLLCDTLLEQDTDASVDKLDLLLALLVYISWGWDHAVNLCSPLRLISLAVSLAQQVRPEGPAPPDVRMMTLFAPGFQSWFGNAGTTTRDSFLERQRAGMACFVLSSTFSICYGQGDALRWTSQMEDGLAAISTNRECPTDATFAAQVRLQLLAQKSVEVRLQQQLEHGQVPATESTNFPSLMALTTLQVQLQEFQLSLSPTLRQQGLVMAHIHSAELNLGEATYAVSSTVPIMVSQFARMTSTGSGSAAAGTSSNASSRQERLRCLWQSVRAIQACSSALLASPPSEFRGISFIQWAQLAHCVTALNRLTNTLTDPTWDCAAVRAVIDVPELLGRIAEKLELAAQAAGEQEPDQVFAKLSRAIHEVHAESGAANERSAEEIEYAWPPTSWMDLPMTGPR